MQLDCSSHTPTISVGVPVYNGEKTLAAALDSLLAQSFTNIEIIISDNASTDKTEDICRSFCEKDKRITYVRQEKNIGAAKNFEFVLKQSKGEYFTWAAADDLRSYDFLEVNINALIKNEKYSASTSPNFLGKKDDLNPHTVTFSLMGNIQERFDEFFKQCWISHGIFYSLMRTEIVKKYPLHGKHFLAADWALDIYLASQGDINRCQEGLIISGADGISSRANPWRPFRTHIIGWVFPLHEFSLYTLKLVSNQSILWRTKLLFKLLKLNLFSAKSQFIAEVYPFYNLYIKLVVKYIKRKTMSLFSKITLRLRRFFESTHGSTFALAEQQLVLQALVIAEKNRSKKDIKSLNDVEFKAFSQWGEDGIIDWLVSRIPSINPSFVEFGVSDYKESNTRLLLQSKNWRGLIIDGSEDNISAIKNQEIYWKYNIEAKQAFITAENINTLITESGYKGEIGLLSVDIDGNDYWVWKAITEVKPAIVICEYNTALGDQLPLTIPYNHKFQRDKAHHSQLYFGASIQAIISLGKEKNYTCIGSTSSGCNAFFIRNDLAHHIIANIDEKMIYPCKAREARNEEGEMLYLNGIEGYSMISHLPVIDLSDNNTQKTIHSIEEKNIFSENWLLGNGENIENSI